MTRSYMAPGARKVSTSYRFSPECKALMYGLSMELGVNLTAVIELAVREMARKYKVAPATTNHQEEGT